MSHQQPGQEAPETPAKKAPLPPFITDCHRNAVNSLTIAFADSRPLAIMIGEGQAGSAFVITRFLSGISGDVVTARISEPSSNAIDLMQEIVSAIGFDPKDMNLTDLDKIFSMFLSFQRSHNRRTIICVEQTQNHGTWVLDRIRQLVEMEAKGHFGLLVILSGTPALSEMLNEPPLNATCAKAGKRINLVPFSLAETKEYIRRRVEGTGAADLGQVFTFNAVTAIQEFSSGVPDKVSDLCSKCLELADLEDMAPISTALVNRASKLIRLESMIEQSDEVEPNLEVVEMRDPNAKLVAFINNALAQEQEINGGHVLIGRDDICDIRLENGQVSRHHALVVNSAMGIKIVDLGSKNGTYVNGKKIHKRTLKDKDKIKVGECSIEYIAGSDQRSWYFDVEPTITLESDEEETRLIGNGSGNGYDAESVNATRTVISPRHFADQS